MDQESDKVTSDLVLASANAGKIKELQQMLGGLGFNIVPQTQLNISDIEETGLTFVENSILKARNAAAHSNLPAVADDSGLEVDFLKARREFTQRGLPARQRQMPAIGTSCWN